MGTCSSKDDDDVVDDLASSVGRSTAVTRSTANTMHYQDRHAKAKSSGALPHDDDMDMQPPGTVDDTDDTEEVTAALPEFDAHAATPAQRGWFAALQRTSMSSSRRKEMLSKLGFTEKETAKLSRTGSGRVNGAFFAATCASKVDSLDALFRACCDASANREDSGRDAKSASTTSSSTALSDGDALDAEGIEALRTALELPNDVHVLYVLHLLGCTDGPWTVPYTVFTEGCMRLLIADQDSLKAFAQKSRAEYDALTVRDAAFADFNGFLFKFVKPAGVRSVPADVAIDLWQHVLAPKWGGGAGDAWLAYVAELPPRPVFRDMWNQLVRFAAIVTWPQCKEADADDALGSAWPTMIDGFIEYSRRPQCNSAAESGQRDDEVA